MLLKTDYSITTEQLDELKKIIGASINYIISEECWHQFHSEKFKFGSKTKILFSDCTDFSCLNLFCLPYIFNEKIGDEVNNINLSLDNNSYYRKKYPSLLHYDKPFHGYLYQDEHGNPFIINKIKIYGEERTRKWSNLLIQAYFSLDAHNDVTQSVSDYLFTKEYIVLENKAGNQLVFRAERGGLTLSFSEKIEVEKSDIRNFFYEKFELDKNYDEEVPFDSNDDMSDEVRLKLHYLIA